MWKQRGRLLGGGAGMTLTMLGIIMLTLALGVIIGLTLGFALQDDRRSND